jgi:YD repeat-containing protein
MKTNRFAEEAAGIAARLLAAFMLLIVAFGANAADYMQCMQAYQKSLGTPGTPTCAIQVAGTTPMSRGADDPYSSMNYYNCPNASDWIKDYCGGAPVPPSPEGSCPVADPVLPAEGIVTLSETDFASGDALPLVFGRTYLSRPYDTSQTAMGRNWVNNWQRRIDLTAVNASTPQIVAYRGNQQPLMFKWNGKVWATLGNRGLSLTKAGNGDYRLIDELLGTTEVYSGNGNLYSETTRTGMLRKFGFDYRQRMVQINQWPVDQIGPNGFKINLQYDDRDRIVGMVDPLGKVTQYAYDVKGNLASVTHPDGSIRQYLYDDARFPNALTGVKDESGSRIATWTYDANARVISVSHPDTTRNTSLNYGSGKTTLSDMYGTSTYSFSFPDAWRPGSIVTPAGTISRKWDIAGNLTQRTTPEGDTQYTWDSANRPTKAIATVAGKKTVITIEYNDASSLRPNLVATPGKIRAFVYDSSGNVTGYAERQTTDLTGEQGLQAIGTGSQLTVGARYDNAGRLLSATITQNGSKIEDWTLSRDAANRATAIAGNSGQADISYDERGRVSVFQYDEKAGVVNGGLARKLVVRYGYAANGTVSTRTAAVATNGGVQQPIGDAELGVWLTNWELGNDPVSPPANLTGLQSDSKAFVPGLCVECYMAWKAKLTERLFGSELSEPLPKWGETTELMLSDQLQVPYPVLVPDLTDSAKRTMLYSALFGAGSGDGGMVKCGGREGHEAECFAQYEVDMTMCNGLARALGVRGTALCKQNAFRNYNQCRGY